MSNFLETKGMLAKLLATENLVVQHDSTAKTASFDTENRVLKLPVLKTPNENVYNLFVSHEVGHALQTPSNWKLDIDEDIPFDFVNVVEDVRIERFIQNKFPGLRVDFSRGYDELNQQNFFDIDGKDLSKFALIDRINLYFKLGARALVPFNDEEMVYVKAVDEADTWQKVLLVSKMLQEYVNAKKNDEMEDMSTTSESEGDGEGEGETESQSSSSNTAKDEQEGDDESDVSPESGNKGSSTEVDELVSQTQQSFDDSLSDMVESKSRNDYIYVNMGDINLDKLVVPVETLRNSMMPSPSRYADAYVEEEKFELKNFLSSIKSDVNHMVQQFEMKKSADAYARQSVHKTGVLNTNALHNYKLTDDIFLRQTVTPDGKCHGMVMLLDWSGSMQDIAFATIKQIITLVQFCRKVQIPFEVYTFTTGDSDMYNKPYALKNTVAHSVSRIVQVITSQAKKQQLEDDIFTLWCTGKGSYSSNLPSSPYLAMGGTPLNNTLLLIPDIIKRFRQQTGAQKVSFVCITDGESSPPQFYEEYTTYRGVDSVKVSMPYYQKVMLKDGHKVYVIEEHMSATGSIINYIKDKCSDVYITNLYLGSGQRSRQYMLNYGIAINEAKFRKQGCFVAKSDTWPLIGVINPKTFGDTTDEIDVQDGASKAKIKSALTKMLKQKNNSKVLLTQMVHEFA